MAAKRSTGRSRTKAPPIKGPKVYSYIRFSTPEQELGDSERRQVDLARTYADKVGLPFDETMIDRGLSGFSGAHRKKGVLGAFLNRVTNGEVVAGSILVVEHVDRLSREGVGQTLRKVIFALFDHGITLQTISPEGTYKPGCENDPQFLALMIYIGQAYESSKRKSDLGNANWEEKRKKALEDGKILTRMHPEWLEVKDGKFKPISHAVKAIRMMYRWREKGLGVRTITQKLNTVAPWQPGEKKKKLGRPGETTEGWIVSYVRKVLTNRAVIGEYQPHTKKPIEGRRVRVPVGDPILNYYPSIVDPALFHRVQKSFAATKGKQVGGRTGKMTNVLQHLCVCGYCGGPMHYKDTGDGNKYLFCIDGRNKKKMSLCSQRETNPSIRYDEVLELVLDRLAAFNLATVMPADDESEQLKQSLQLKLERLHATQSDMQDRTANLNEQIETTKDAKRRAHYESRIIELEKEQSDLAKKIATAQHELSQLADTSNRLEEWQASLRNLKDELGKNVETRQRVNSLLREFVGEICIYSQGYSSIEGDLMDRWWSPKDTFAETFRKILAPNRKCFSRTDWKQVTDCIEALTALRQTKQGRWLSIGLKLSVGRLFRLLPGTELDSLRGQELGRWRIDKKTGVGMEPELASRTFEVYIAATPPGSYGGPPDADLAKRLGLEKAVETSNPRWLANYNDAIG